MKYQIIKNGTDDYTLKYKDKEIKFHSDVETVTELQRVNEIGKQRMIIDLAKQGVTINELVKEVKKDGKTYYDNSNKDEMIKVYATRVAEELFNKAVKKMLGMELTELVKELNIETQEEVDKYTLSSTPPPSSHWLLMQPPSARCPSPG